MSGIITGAGGGAVVLVKRIPSPSIIAYSMSVRSVLKQPACVDLHKVALAAGGNYVQIADWFVANLLARCHQRQLISQLILDLCEAVESLQ